LATLWLFAGTPVASASAQDADTAAMRNNEVERLRQLLQRYHKESGGTAPSPASSSSASERPADTSQRDLDERLAQGFSTDKLILRADELPLLISVVEARLNRDLTEERRNDLPLIGSLQTRRRGSLVGSHSYNLTHIGQYQFVSRLDLTAGTNTLTVVDRQWTVKLPETDADPSYLMFLYAAPLDNWELHLIPAAAVDNTKDKLPAWLTAFTASRPAP
jgi:hypothetical protein